MNTESRLAEHRSSRTRTRAASAAAFLAFALGSVCAHATSISSTEGKVLFLKAGSHTWAQVSTGQILATGDQLKTASGGQATVMFDDASRVDLNPGSSFTLKEATPQASGMELELGSLKAWISKNLNRRFQVRTPTAVLSVRGTEFSVGVDARGDTRVQMFSGLLAVVDKKGKEVLVKDTQSIEVTHKGLGRVSDGLRQEERGDGEARQSAKRLDKAKSSLQNLSAAISERNLRAFMKNFSPDYLGGGDQLRDEVKAFLRSASEAHVSFSPGALELQGDKANLPANWEQRLTMTDGRQINRKGNTLFVFERESGLVAAMKGEPFWQAPVAEGVIREAGVGAPSTEDKTSRDRPGTHPEPDSESPGTAKPLYP